jgi:hypothetical protein
VNISASLASYAVSASANLEAIAGDVRELASRRSTSLYECLCFFCPWHWRHGWEATLAKLVEHGVDQLLPWPLHARHPTGSASAALPLMSRLPVQLLALAGAVARDLACSAALKAITSGLGLCARSTAVERDLVSVHVHLWYADSELLVRSTHRPGHRVLATLALKHFRILDRAQSSHAGLSRGECPDEIANSIALGGC